MSERGGVREGAGRPEAIFPRTAFSMRLTNVTVERVERFAKSRGLNRTQALETIVEEYVQVLDGLILPGRWHPEPFKRPGLKTFVAEDLVKRAARRGR